MKVSIALMELKILANVNDLCCINSIAKMYHQNKFNLYINVNYLCSKMVKYK